MQLEISLTNREAEVIDAVRLSFALNSFPLLPAKLQALLAPDLPATRVRDLLVFAWDEQVQLALEDGILTEAELDALAQAAVTLGIAELVRERPSHSRLLEAAARQRAGLPLKRPRKRRRKANVESASPAQPPAAPEQTAQEFAVAAVGESHYQSSLRSALGQRTAPAGCDAALVPEPENPYDALAVRVDVHGVCVGYLNRTHARIYRRRYGDRSISCKAMLHGGDAGRPSIGIWLSLLL